MSKYDKLWEYLRKKGNISFELTFDEIECIAGVPVDHSFLRYKGELINYGYAVGKISMKNKTVSFDKV